MLYGKNLIDGAWVGSSNNLGSDDLNGFKFAQATTTDVDQAAIAARKAFRSYSKKSRFERSNFLRTIADEMDKLGEEITEIGSKETGLPKGRLEGERGRTTGQLKMFADLIENVTYLDIRKDEALPNRGPIPRPDLRLTHKAIGPVVVFGASNFPLAFSTAGGDTASALAAGCPVIVKGHSAHAGTAELVAQAIISAIEICKMPRATFQMVQGSGREVGAALVKHTEISAVGFTGSLGGGRALYDLCHQRPTPIPFYGELGSINPMFILPSAAENRAEALGEGWAGSLTMGAGQFCTNPGVTVIIKGTAAERMESSCVAALKNVEEQKMLTDEIHKAFEGGVQLFADLMENISNCGTATSRRSSLPALFKVSAKQWMENLTLQNEVFGAAGILVVCNDINEMQSVAECLEGQLTATLHLDDLDHDLAWNLLPILEEKAGRVLCNGFPTGVEVCSSMMHGGPYPASTDVRTTSVGTLAIVRWLRPISYQNVPKALLPDELK